MMRKAVVAVIKRPRDRKFLLVSSTKDFGKFTGFFYPPGGKIEKGEGKKEALRRELKEELNLVIKPIREIAKTRADVKNQLTFWWECKIISGELEKSDEIDKVGYYSRKEMKKLNIWPATEFFFKKYIDKG